MKFLILAAAGAAGLYIYTKKETKRVGPALPPTIKDLEKPLPKPSFEIPPLPWELQMPRVKSDAPIPPLPVMRDYIKGPGQISPPFGI